MSIEGAVVEIRTHIQRPLTFTIILGINLTFIDKFKLCIEGAVLKIRTYIWRPLLFTSILGINSHFSHRQVRTMAPSALIYVDAVHYAPHVAIDVQDLDCDFCVCSTFKFFGPHCGMLFGKSELMTNLRPYKLSVCADTLPGPPNPNQFQRWETGTLNFEGLAGIAAVIDYIGSLGKFMHVIFGRFLSIFGVFYNAF